MYSTREKDKRESFAVKISFIPNTLFSLLSPSLTLIGGASARKAYITFQLWWKYEINSFLYLHTRSSIFPITETASAAEMQFSYSTFATQYSRWVKSAAITRVFTEGSQTTSTKTSRDSLPGERKKDMLLKGFF